LIEEQQPEHRALYERHGFVVVEEVGLPGRGPTI